MRDLDLHESPAGVKPSAADTSTDSRMADAARVLTVLLERCDGEHDWHTCVRCLMREELDQKCSLARRRLRTALRAVKCHDALVSALSALVDALDPINLDLQTCAVLDAAIAVLAKVEVSHA